MWRDCSAPIPSGSTLVALQTDIQTEVGVSVEVASGASGASGVQLWLEQRRRPLRRDRTRQLPHESAQEPFEYGFPSLTPVFPIGAHERLLQFDICPCIW